MNQFVYKDGKTSQISFPLGGIGTGSIGLAGNGRLIDWEIFNRPNKGSVNGFSHFAVRAESDDQVLDARILNGDLQPHYMGDFNTPQFSTFGWGPRREYLTGLPHFRDVTFVGEFPLAELEFEPEQFPGQVTMRAFNPFIPLKDEDSSIPAALFEISITNTTESPIDYTVAGVLSNPLPANNLNTVETTGWGHALHLRSDSVGPQAVGYGDLTLATDAGKEDDADVSWQQYWFRGAWFDNLEVYWHDLTTPGPFQNRKYPPGQAGDKNEGLLAVRVPVAPGATRSVRFVITWNFPNCQNYWKEGVSGTWRNYYAALWANSMESARYVLENWRRLHAETRRFKDSLYNSALPRAALEAVSANLSVLKSPTVLRLEDGTFYGWEGCHPHTGCCEGSCTHVWNYAQALAFLFPSLERSMREADFAYNLRADGGMPFRLQLPLGSGRSTFRPCADGQFGGVMKTYRDWKIFGDTEWLRKLWPAVKASIEFAWHPENEDRWDPDKTGVLWGRQHHTLDMELFGPNSWLTGMYLGALKAGAEMAEHLGDSESAYEYRAIFARGKGWADEHLFNGEYYCQRIDLKDKGVVEAFAGNDDVLRGGTTLGAYWADEYQEIKYQIAEGSEIDQVLAQWHANLYGLGEIYDPVQVKKALTSLFRYNFKDQMRDSYNPCRIYCLNDEAGLVICAWPERAYKPVIPLPYSQETQNGYEYGAAIQMIQTGLIKEGMAVVSAIRDRYDGEKRNPWNEFECGSNYARSMASYSLLNAFAGFQFDMTQGMIGFNPLQPEDGRFRCFWSLDPGWGEFELWPGRAEVRLLAGQLPLQAVHLPFLADTAVRSVTLGDKPIPFDREGAIVRLASPVEVGEGQVVAIVWHDK